MKVGLLKVAVALAGSLLFSSVVLAENRAEITHLTAILKLPDQSALTVDMSLDCGSRYERTALVVTSRQGAEILSTAWTALYGPEAGAAVMKQWETKTNPDDPRLPTFMIVTPPEGKSYIASPKTPASLSKRKMTTLSDSAAVPVVEAARDSEILTTCGHKDHAVY